MGEHDGLNTRIVVSLWTVHVVTVLFVVVSLSVWLALFNRVVIDYAGLRITAMVFLDLLLIFCLVAEFRFYVRNVLNITTYMRLQILKAAFWMMFLYMLLGAASGVDDEGIQIFREAAKKLL
jgi:hypothetical protein